MDVERGARPDLHARGADAVGLAVDRVLAVEGHGQDPGGGGLAGPSGPAEQVGVGDPVRRGRRCAGPGHVVLAPDLGESLRPVPPIQRLVGRVARPCRHGRAYRQGVTTRRGRSRRAETWRPARRPGDLRHTVRSAESCCRQALTRFTVHPLRRTQPPRRTPGLVRTGYAWCIRSHAEGCESGRIGTIGNRVWRKSPWVQIPPSPPSSQTTGRAGSGLAWPSPNGRLSGHSAHTGARRPRDVTRVATPISGR